MSHLITEGTRRGIPFQEVSTFHYFYISVTFLHNDFACYSNRVVNFRTFRFSQKRGYSFYNMLYLLITLIVIYLQQMPQFQLGNLAHNIQSELFRIYLIVIIRAIDKYFKNNNEFNL